MNRSRSLFLLLEIGIFLLGVSGSVYAALTPANSMMNWYNSDDAFYYYKVANNVLNGQGFSFDGINLSNGFHPLWMVVCLGVFWLSRFHLLLPLRVLIVVSGILNGFTGIVLLRLLRKYLPLTAAILGSSVWMLLPSIHFNFTARGLESTITAFFVALLLYKSSSLLSEGEEKRSKGLILVGLIAALTILSRLDTLFVVALVGFFIVFRITRINRIIIYDLVAVLLGSIFAWIIRFGTTPLILNNYSIYPQMVVALALTPAVLYFTGFYSLPIKKGLVRFFVHIGIAFILTGILLYLVLLTMQVIGMNLLVSQSLILLNIALTFILILFIHLLHNPANNTASHSAWQIFKNWSRTELRQNIQDGVLFSVPIAFLVGGYMLANKLIFGTFSPVSGQVKTWWGTLGNTVYRQNETLVELMGFAPGSGGSPWSLLTTIVADISIFVRDLFGKDSHDLPVKLFLTFIFLIFILLVFLLSRKNGFLARRSFAILIPPMAIGCFLHIAYYAARNYGHTRSWYWVPETMLLVLLGTVLSSRFFEKLKQWTRTPLPGNILLLGMIGFVIFLHTRYILSLCPPTVPLKNQADYLVETRDLEFYTRENSLIGMTGGGEIAYFIQNRTVVNMDGLINSLDYFEALKTGTADRFLSDMNLDYVFGNPYMLLETEPYRQIFSGRIEKIGQIQGESSFTLYRYLDNQ